MIEMRKIISGVYTITSKLDPSYFYVGSSIDVKHRWVRHKRELRKNGHGNIIMQRYYNKHGKGCFKFKVIERTSNLMDREQFYIDTLQPTFNICPKAYSRLGTTQRPEVVERIVKGLIGRPVSNETRDKIGKPQRGIKRGPQSEEHKRLRAMSIRGLITPEERKERRNQRRLNRKLAKKLK